MNLLSHKFWGTVLIGLGSLIFLGVIYDSIRPYFPGHPPYQFLKTIHPFLKERFSARTPTPKEKRAPARPRHRQIRPPLPPARRGLLTSNVHQTKGNYNLWVWGVKPQYRTGDTVKVEMAHASDGQPDKEIARSDFLTVPKPGEWSSFEFTTPEKTIFVGNTWPRGSNTWVFRGNGLWPQADCPFVYRFYHLISPNKKTMAGPAFTNLRVSFSD